MTHLDFIPKQQIIPVLWLASIRYLLRHPWQFGLSILGVALGVAVVISIDLTNDSARRGFALSLESVVGKTTHHIVSSTGEVPETLYQQIRSEMRIRQSAPIVEGMVTVPQAPGQVFQVLGVDPFAEQPFRSYLSYLNSTGNQLLSQFITQPQSVLLAQATATRLGLQNGDVLTVQIGMQMHELQVIGILEAQNELTSEAIHQLMVMDIATAQEILNKVGYLSRIDLIFSKDDQTLEQLREILPPGIELMVSSDRMSAAEKLTQAFHLNLTALSLLALLVGMFLIYNTMTFSVVQRYSLFGRLRSMGVSRREIFGIIMGESFFISCFGILLGVGLGIVLANLLLELVTRTINDLYYVLSIRTLHLSVFSLSKGVGLGIGATFIASSLPAWYASQALPKKIDTRSLQEERYYLQMKKGSLVGMLMTGLGSLLLFLPMVDLWVSYAGLFIAMVGCALLVPVGTMFLLYLVKMFLKQGTGTFGLMVVRGVQADLSRTSVAIAALMIAIAATIGLEIMIQSFRAAVAQWVNISLQADIYLSPPALVSNRDQVFLQKSFIDKVTTLSDIAEFGKYRRFSVNLNKQSIPVVALQIPQRGWGAFHFKDIISDDFWNDFKQNDTVLISEALAFRQSLQVGDKVELQTQQGVNSFQISGIFYDYSSAQGLLMMSYQNLEKYWHDSRVNSFALYLKNDQSLEDVLIQLRQLVEPSQQVWMNSNHKLREQTLIVFDRTFAITQVLRILIAGVAFVGVFSALMALQLERQKELGTLRALGLTPRQLAGLVSLQCLLMGLIAGVIAIPVGIFQAFALIFAINQRSFGWTFPMMFSSNIFIQGVCLALIASVLAGIYPSIKMGNTLPTAALREE